MELTKEQVKAIIQKFTQNNSGYLTKEDMILMANPVMCADGAVSVQWCGMWLCIEKDGHCHS